MKLWLIVYMLPRRIVPQGGHDYVSRYCSSGQCTPSHSHSRCIHCMSHLRSGSGVCTVDNSEAALQPK